MAQHTHPDIDIDMANRDDLLGLTKHSAARIDREGGYDRHNTGVYFQAIPTNPVDGVATIDHHTAGDFGYFKLDLLNNSVYQSVRDNQHLEELMHTEPDWDMLVDARVVSQLYHVHRYVHLLRQHQPRSIEQLAMVLAIIRPGKSHLQGKSWEEIQADVWVPPRDGQYHFKRAHAVAFAYVIVVQLNLIRENQA